MKLAFAAALAFALSPAAFAAKAKHHCMGSDGSDVAAAKTKKQCKKAGGKWMKMKAGDTSSSAMPPPAK